MQKERKQKNEMPPLSLFFSLKRASTSTNSSKKTKKKKRRRRALGPPRGLPRSGARSEWRAPLWVPSCAATVLPSPSSGSGGGAVSPWGRGWVRRRRAASAGVWRRRWWLLRRAGVRSAGSDVYRFVFLFFSFLTEERGGKVFSFLFFSFRSLSHLFFFVFLSLSSKNDDDERTNQQTGGPQSSIDCLGPCLLALCCCCMLSK